MSAKPANAEIVEVAYEAINRRDMDAFLELLDREIEWRGSRDSTDPGTYTGESGVIRFFDTRHDVWDEYVQEPERLIESGEHVVAIVTLRARGRGSGIEVADQAGHLWELRDGKVLRFQSYDDPQDALAAAGLSADA